MNPSTLTFPQKLLKPVIFFHPLTTTSLSSPSPLPQQQQQEEEQEELIINPATDHSYWAHKIHTITTTDVDASLRLVDRLRLYGYRPSPATLSTIITTLCSCRRFVEAHRRLSLLLSSSQWLPDDRTANALIARLLDSRRTPHLTLRIVHHFAHCNRNFRPTLTNYNRLIDQFCALGRLSDARNLFGTMLSRNHKPNVVSYTTLMNGYVRIGLLDDARQVFDEMCQSGVSPNSLTLSVLIKGVLRKRRVDEGRELMVKLWVMMPEEEERGDDPSVRSAAFANLIYSLCREGFFHEVFRIAEEMPQGKWVGEEFAYGQMIDSLCRAGRHHGASRIVYIMRRRGFVPSLVSYNSIVHGLSKGKGCMRAYQLFKEGIGFGYWLPEPTYIVLVEGLCKEMDVGKAKDVAEFMLAGVDGVGKTKIYNIFLSALRLVGNPSEQLNVLVSMLHKQCKPDIVTLNTIIHGFCKIGKAIEASRILNDMLKGKFCAPDVVTFTTIIRGLLDVGKPEEALDLLHRVMPANSCSPNVVTCNAVLSGLCKLKNACEAMEIFSQMAGKGVSPDSTTHTAIIEGLCEVGQLEEAKRFWDHIVWPSKIHDDYVYAAILRGLCRSGKLDAACDFLYELVDCGISPGIVNYNILIDAACKLGLKKEAYQIVGEMRKNGLKPDAVTWRILDKLHDQESKIHADGNLYLQTKSGVSAEERMGNKIEKVVGEEGECDNEIDEQGDTLEGLVDPCFSTKVFEADRINEEPTITSKVDLGSKVSKSELLKPTQKEPLSRIVRRVFGLLLRYNRNMKLHRCYTSNVRKKVV